MVTCQSGVINGLIDVMRKGEEERKELGEELLIKLQQLQASEIKKKLALRMVASQIWVCFCEVNCILFRKLCFFCIKTLHALKSSCQE